MDDDFGKSLSEGLKYPWGQPVRLLNILWVLLPIFGWFALIGYGKKIILSLVKGHRTELPPFGSFSKNLSEGFMIFIYMIPTMIVLMIIQMIPLVGYILGLLVNWFILPWLTINLMVKGEFSALWELEQAFNVVVNNAKAYVIAFVKTLVYSVVYFVLSFVLVGIPCNAFGGMYFLTEFYSDYS